MVIISIISLTLSIGCLIYVKKYKENCKKQQVQYKKELYEKRCRTLEIEIQEKKEEFERKLEEEKAKIKLKYDTDINSLKEKRNIVAKSKADLENQFSLLEQLLEKEKEKVSIELDKFKQIEILKTTDALNREVEAAEARAREYSFSYIADVKDETNKTICEIEEKKQQYINECEEIKRQLDDFKEKQFIINQEIFRQRELKEQKDFYRIQLSTQTIHDVACINSIRKDLFENEQFNKLIYSVYYAKPTMEMIRRVLKGSAPCGIYKITRLKTGEIYIGKSVDIKSRWQNHVKTSCNCGTIAYSRLHKMMQDDGIDNFTFELLEKTTKDKLTEREKYWIDFFDSKKYGLNERNG